MKRRIFLAMLLCIVSVLGLRAQTWTASEVGTGDFFLYNVGKGQYLTRGNGWGTQASVSANSALTVTLEEYSGAYKLGNRSSYGIENLDGGTIYTDQSRSKNSTWTFTKVADGSNGPIYTIVSADNHGGGSGSYMTASADNTIVGPASSVSDDYGRWQLLQSWITNSVPVNESTGWTVSQTPTFDGGNVCAEYWNKSGASIKQTVTNLPKGSYELIAVAFTRTGMTATLNAGTNTMSIATVGSDEVNGRGDANTWFNNGNGVNKLEFTLAETTASLEIGLTADNTTGDHWMVWRSFVLIYKGIDLTEFKAALQAQIDAVPPLEGTTTTAAYNAAKNYADGIDMDALTTEQAITTALSELTTLVDAAKALQTNYARYQTIKTAAKAIASGLVTTTPDAQVEAATTNDAIDTAIASLRATFLAELPNLTIPADPGYIDVTAAMVDNAGVHTNTDYWTKEGTPNGGYSFGVCNYGECEFYNCNFKFYQTLALTPGTWEFGVTGFHRAGNHNTHFYAGADQILIPGVESSVVNSMSAAQTYFDNGNGQVALKFLVEQAQNVEIGINNEDTETDKWTIFRDFTLKYYGAPDYSVYDQQWADAVAAANAAKADVANANVTGAELTALNAAIADAPNTTNPTQASYQEKILALQAATQAFIAAAPSYDLYAQYNVTLSYADSSKKPTVTSSSTAATILSALRAYYESHALAEGVSGAVDMTSSITNPTDPTDNSGWTVNGSINDPRSSESWTDADGTNNHSYFDGGNWGAQSWTTTMEQTVTIPAGRYLLTAKGRAAANVTFTMEAAGESVDLPHIGATAGTGLFDRGWNDASVEFTTYGDATILVTATTTDHEHEWFSISDFRLVQLEEITVPMADATDYAALTAAINAAEAKTLGFESGQYAPYNNVAALQALAAAKAIDQTASNVQPIVQSATTALTSATWTANSAWVQPIYNGMFATVAEGANYPEGWRRSNNWGQMRTGIEGDFATAYYNQPGSLVYGDQGVYTMPLPANQAFKLTFSYRSHEENSNGGMTVRVSNNGNDLIAPTYDSNGSTSTWKTEYAYFTTGAAGNYVLTLANSGNTWMTNVSMEKITSTQEAGDLNGDGKIDATDELIENLRYTAGDFNNTGAIESSDVTTLASILVGKTTDYNENVADVDGMGGVTLADLTYLVNVKEGTATPRIVDDTQKYATINATVYAEQKATENTSANYTIDSAVCTLTNEAIADPASKYDMTDYLTTLRITVSISGAQSVSVYAKGKENIAGVMACTVAPNTATSYTYSAGSTPSVYVNGDRDDVNGKNMQSDVVTVVGEFGGASGTYVAYLLPVALSNGVTVTVRDNNGKFYSQDFTVTAGQENNLTFTETAATNNWMATIPGNINFSMLSTPGSHNSATSNCSSAAKCQSETIAQQLANGVRAFDIRPTYKYSTTITSSNLYIYHGMVNTNVLYKDAIAAMVEFLQAHPTEAISVIMVKEDGTPLLSSWTDYTNEMCAAIDEIHTTYTDYIKLLDHSYYTLDDYRGKIFFGYRNAWDLHKTVRVTNWPDAASVTDYSVGVGGQCYASVEDAYNTSGDSKKTVINTLLDLASANENRARFHYTFTSVANSITSSAGTQNPAAATYISGTLTGPTGYVYADFMGSSSYSGQTLLKAVIEQNYKYVFKGRTRKQ